ncbi:hypothetical protein CPB85DRAFT_391711 [Mucidula mucida]|nr:hypothetical protein CPB85DRAFT_391711 [Mucidula mucida]
MLAGTVAIKALEEARYALRSYARFLHHLGSTTSPDRQSLLGFSLRRLKTMGRNVEPVGEELLDNDIDFVTVNVDDSFYGLELTNRTDLRLFVHILWFDPSASEIGRSLSFLFTLVLLLVIGAVVRPLRRKRTDKCSWCPTAGSWKSSLRWFRKRRRPSVLL